MSPTLEVPLAKQGTKVQIVHPTFYLMVKILKIIFLHNDANIYP